VKPVRDSIDDLIVLARRGDLSEADRQRLDEALALSPEARLLYDAGRAFDLEAQVVAGDDERVAEIERAVRRGRRRHGFWSPRRLRAAVPAAVAAVFAAGVAVGAIELSHGFLRSGPQAAASVAPAPPVSPAAGPAGAVRTGAGLRPETPQPAPAASDTPAIVAALAAAPSAALPEPVHGAPQGLLSERSATRAEPAPSRGRSVDIAAAPATAAPQPPAPARNDDNEDTQAQGAAAESPPPSPSAQQLFSQANVARVRGDPGEAMVLLRQLERRFPASSEAAAAHLSLGMLLLQGGQAGPALDELRSYGAQGATAMVPEALWGESQALRELGRSDEERATLENLLRGYPTSAYAAAARKRLAELP
jgi:TolA-binding protein